MESSPPAPPYVRPAFHHPRLQPRSSPYLHPPITHNTSCCLTREAEARLFYLSIGTDVTAEGLASNPQTRTHQYPTPGNSSPLPTSEHPLVTPISRSPCRSSRPNDPVQRDPSKRLESLDALITHCCSLLHPRDLAFLPLTATSCALRCTFSGICHVRSSSSVKTPAYPVCDNHRDDRRDEADDTIRIYSDTGLF